MNHKILFAAACVLTLQAQTSLSYAMEMDQESPAAMFTRVKALEALGR